jgi:hypothetical protein
MRLHSFRIGDTPESCAQPRNTPDRRAVWPPRRDTPSSEVGQYRAGTTTLCYQNSSEAVCDWLRLTNLTRLSYICAES